MACCWYLFVGRDMACWNIDDPGPVTRLFNLALSTFLQQELPSDTMYYKHAGSWMLTPGSMTCALIFPLMGLKSCTHHRCNPGKGVCPSLCPSTGAC